MSLGEAIRDRRRALEMTQDRVAEQAGISKPYLSNIETGRANPPSDEVLRNLERALKFDKGDLRHMAHRERMPVDLRHEHDWLLREYRTLRRTLEKLLDSGEAPRTVAESLEGLSEGNVRPVDAGAVVPVINSVAAGYPQHFTDLDYPVSIADEYVHCPGVRDAQAFAARIVGDSMEPRYQQGDIVVFSPNTPAGNGDDCFVRFEQDAGTTFKRVYQDDPETVRLQPLNPSYPAEVYNRRQITGLWPAVFRIERLR